MGRSMTRRRVNRETKGSEGQIEITLFETRFDASNTGTAEARRLILRP